MNYWLMKSEPDTFSFLDLKSRPKRREPWDGVRNYQARNYMRDSMEIGDLVLFYHSNIKKPGVVGIAEIVSNAYPDPTAFDQKSKYFDSKSDLENPRWFLVDVAFYQDLKNIMTLDEMKEIDQLKDMKILQKGNRLSITPVKKDEFDLIVSLANN